MAIKISALDSAAALSGAEVLPLVQSGVTKQVALTDLSVNVSFTTSLGGAFTVASATFKLMRIGKLVTVQCPVITAAVTVATGIVAADVGFPAAWRPSANVCCPVMLLNNSVVVSGYVMVTTTGVLVFSTNTGNLSGTSGIGNGATGAVFSYLAA